MTDVDYAELDGVSPMRKVIADRKRQANASPRAQREAAFRERAFMQAQLASCLCSVPLVMADTVSGHQLWCPGHHLLLSKRAQEKLHRR